MMDLNITTDYNITTNTSTSVPGILTSILSGNYSSTVTEIQTTIQSVNNTAQYDVTSPFTVNQTTASPLPFTTVVGPITDDVNDLMWVMPVVLGMVFFLAGIAWVVFCVIRQCEVAVLKFCYKKFGCCPPSDRSKRDYASLKEDDVDSDTLYMKEVRPDHNPRPVPVRSPFDSLTSESDTYQ